MNLGKVSETILKRSILKQIRTKRSEVIKGAEASLDCAVISNDHTGFMLVSCDPLTIDINDKEYYSIVKSINNIAAAGGQTIGVMLSILVLCEFEETDIKLIMKKSEEVCAKYNIQIMGGHTEVTNAVTRPVINVTAVGSSVEELSQKAYVGQDIVITGEVGIEGTAIIAERYREELIKRFSTTYIDKAIEFKHEVPILSEAAVAVKHGVTAMHDISFGGIFGALWDLGESNRLGISVDIKKIPIRQETIEICEYFDMNPYQMLSGGSLIIASNDGNGLVKALKEQGLSAKVVGKVIEGHDKVIINQDETRFLEPPKGDEIYRIFE